MKKRLQNKVAESRMALLITSIYAIGIWIIGDIGHHWMQFALMFLATYLMVELNNQNALMRTYSRMHSCSFLAIYCASLFIFQQLGPSVVVLSWIICYLFAFRSYQQPEASGLVFTAFVTIGIASVSFIQVLFFVPVLWVILATRVMSLSWHTFWASVLGLVTPYWFVGGYYVYTDKIDILLSHFTEITRFGRICDLNIVGSQQIVTFLFVIALGLIGTIHFLLNSYKDKIRTRMFYELFITIEGVTTLFLVLQPQHYHYLMPILIVNVAPLIGHYITFTRTRLSNLSFIAIVCATLLLTAYNLWIF